MIREKKLERRRHRRKVAEQLQQEQEPEMMVVSPSYTSVSPSITSNQQQKALDSVVAKQHAPDTDMDQVRRRRRRQRQKQMSVDNECPEKYENGWVAAKSESEHLLGALNNTDLQASRSESSALHRDAAASLTPHPAVRSSVSMPFVNRDLIIQPAFLQKLSNGSDTYYQPHQSNVLMFFFCYS